MLRGATERDGLRGKFEETLPVTEDHRGLLKQKDLRTVSGLREAGLAGKNIYDPLGRQCSVGPDFPCVRVLMTAAPTPQGSRVCAVSRNTWSGSGGAKAPAQVDYPVQVVF